MEKYIFFFLGTEAELIKIFPIILECKKRKISYKLIVSGQNDVEHSRILKEINCSADLVLDRGAHITTGWELIRWWLKVFSYAKRKIKNSFPEIDYRNSAMIVHGDTVSTCMGGLLGRMLHMQVCHVEAGLRSYHLFNPLPEEIDRIFTSKCAHIHFAPGDVPERNLRKTKGIVINTAHNTLSDSLKYAINIPLEDMKLQNILLQDYFVFVMHRQENLMNEKFVKDVVERIEIIAEKMKCVIILHAITKNTFEKIGIMEKLKRNSNIVMFPRVNYFDFMKLLKNSNFVISDGGSNQEELYYMGKPCLIMRKSTERDEGIGQNGIMFNGDINAIDRFAKSYHEMSKGEPYIETSPSRIIVDYLEKESVVSK